MARRKYYYKSLKFTFGSNEEVVRFLDLASKKVKVFQMYARTRTGTNVEIILVGDPCEVNLAISELRKLAKTIRDMYRRERGLATYDQHMILESARLEAAIPLDVVYRTLELLGHRVEQLKDGRIRTDASFDEVVQLTEKVSKLYKEMMEMDITPQAKRIVAMYCIVFDRTIEEALAELEELGLLKRYVSPERQLMVLATTYEDAFRRLKEFVEKFRKEPEIIEQLRARVREKILKLEKAGFDVSALKRAILGTTGGEGPTLAEVAEIRASEEAAQELEKVLEEAAPQEEQTEEQTLENGEIEETIEAAGEEETEEYYQESEEETESEEGSEGSE